MNTINSIFTVYKVTNLINGKFYIGVHKTKKINDSYFGSGVAIKRSIKKYGKNNFRKDVLFVFDNENDAYLKEKELVNEGLLKDKKCYNETIGGVGGFYHIPPKFGNDSPMRNEEIKIKAIQKMKETRAKNKEHFDSISRENLKHSKKSHSKEANKKRSEKMTGRKLKKSQIEKFVASINNYYLDLEKNPERKKLRSESLKKSYTTERLKLWSDKFKGSNNPIFSGYYITPKGRFDSLSEAGKANDLSVTTICNRCKYKNKDIITNITLQKGKGLCPIKDKHLLGKTWCDLGWNFEPKNKDQM